MTSLRRWKTCWGVVLVLGIAIVAPSASAGPQDIFIKVDGIPGDTGAKPFIGSFGPSPVQGFVQEQVIVASNNPFCKDCLDFVYSFQNTGSQPITRSIASGFFGFSTIVGFDSSRSFFPSSGPPQSPFLAYPTTDGSEIFDFSSLQNGSVGVQNGYSTFNLVIETNATAFASTGSFSFSGGLGSDAAVSGFAPVPAPTPEPASVLLYASGIGILFCGYLIQRKKPASTIA